MSSHHDTHDNDSSIWKVLNVLIAAGFTLFTVVAGLSLIFGGYKKSRAHGPQPEPAAAAAPAAPAADAAPAAPAPAAAVPATPAASAPAPAAGGVAEFTIRPGAANPMSFDITSITVKAGQKVKLTFSNDGSVPLQHNLILCKPGSKERMIALANTMMADMGKWLPLGFVPDSPDVIAHTRLLNMKESQTLEFTVPAEKGDYPYVCTFPGHSMIMNGTMKVE